MRPNDTPENHADSGSPEFGASSPARWLTREEIAAQYPISASTLARIPKEVLNHGMVGKSAVYERRDVEQLFERIKGSSLKDLVDASKRGRTDSAKDQGSETPRKRGRPKNPVIVP